MRNDLNARSTTHRVRSYGEPSKSALYMARRRIKVNLETLTLLAYSFRDSKSFALLI